MPKAKPQRELSRLELAVLGLVSKGAPCTAYWIRRQFQASPSSFFSGSAGAVYPAMKRLEERSLVKAAAKETGLRRSMEYRLTARGRDALEAWLSPPLPPEDVAFTLDPIRTRVYYLEALSPADRHRFVDEALAHAKLRVAIADAEAEERRQSGDEFGYLGSRGVVHEARARVRWLEELGRSLAPGEND